MSRSSNLNRRAFLKNTALGVAGAGIFPIQNLAQTQEKSATPLAKVKGYRILGRTGFKVSDIGCGGTPPVGVLGALLDAGLNYIDSSETYGNGAAERNIGQAIQGRERKNIFITTKLSFRDKQNTQDEIIGRFHQSLERLKTDYVDCLMIHGPATVEALKNEAFHQAFVQLKGEGKVRFCGVSNHGSQYEEAPVSMEQVLLAAAADGRFDVFLLVYNFLQRDQAEKIFQACQDKDIGITIMKSNPVGKYLGMKERIENMKKEGRKIEERMEKLLERLKGRAQEAEAFVKKHHLQNPAAIRDAAIRFILDNPHVHTVNFAFNNFEDIDSVIGLSGTKFGSEDKQKLVAFEKSFGQFYCRHACGICERVCPDKVPVNTIMRYNHYFVAQGREKEAMEKYGRLPGSNANGCADCQGYCQKACPHGLEIQPMLYLAHQQLTIPS